MHTPQVRGLDRDSDGWTRLRGHLGRPVVHYSRKWELEAEKLTRSGCFVGNSR